jgi:hypothetical protein
MQNSRTFARRHSLRLFVCPLAVAVAACVGGGFAHVHAGKIGQTGHEEHCFAAGRCILCNAYGASHAPRICGSCNNKFNNRCILCNAYGANIAPRICGSCNNKFNNRCILCNAYGASSLPRICNSCNNKH